MIGILNPLKKFLAPANALPAFCTPPYKPLCAPAGNGTLAVPVCRFAVNPLNLLGLTGCVVAPCPTLLRLDLYCCPLPATWLPLASDLGTNPAGLEPRDVVCPDPICGLPDL